jgi:TonB-linked SusC/RagA family outer membrane protein
MIKHSLMLLLLLVVSITAFAQVRTVKGRVLDKNKQPIPGAHVLLKGSRIGTSTGMNGDFSIKLSDANTTLIVSMVGYKTVEFAVGKQTEVIATLEDENVRLEEAIVLGYGSKKSRESVVGAVEQISARELKIDRVSESVDKMLEGRIAGVYVESSSGDPGTASISIQVRGQGALSKVSDADIVSSSQPLIIVDGVPLKDASNPNRDKKFSNDLTQSNPLSMINPDDIESVTVLKDAATAAIYGANAANGVILITTKRGQAGKASFNISHQMSFGSIINEMKFLNTEQYVKLAIEAQTNAGVDLATATEKAGPSSINTNWYDLVTRTSKTSQTNMSVSGGSGNTTYRFSAGYSNTQSISLGNQLSRITSRLNLNTKLSDRLDFDMIFGFGISDKDAYSIYGNAFAFKPNLSPYNADGSFNNTAPFDKIANPLAVLAQNKNQKKDYSTNGSATLNFHITKDISLKSLFGIDLNNSRSYIFDSKKNAAGANAGGRVKDVHETDLTWISSTTIDWSKTINDFHSISAMAGVELKDEKTNGLRVVESKLPIEKLPIIGYGSNENTAAYASETSEGSLSYFGRLSYSYDQSKYNLSVNIRRDASSIFGGDVQAQLFGSVGATWVMSKEKWFPTKYINYAKIRASYGSTGNSRIGSYSARGTYSYNSSYFYNGVAGSKPNSAPNPSLSWEKNYKLNIGADFSILKSKVNISVDYYRNNVYDAIQSLSVPLETGFTSVSANTSDMVNKGVEITVKTRNIDREFKWRTNLNIANNSNKITRLSNNLDMLPPSSYTYTGLKVGKDVSSIFTARFAGVDPQTGSSLWYLKDGTITNDARLGNSIENRVYVGKANPDFFGGFVNDFEYKQFTLSIATSFNIGGHKTIPYNYLYMNSDGRQILIQNQSINQLNRWTTPGQITDVPKLSTDNYVGYGSTRYLYDLTNIALKTISLSYRIPKELAKKVWLDNASINCQVSNLAYWYKDKNGGDGNGIAEYRYGFPESRIVTFGIDLRF